MLEALATGAGYFPVPGFTTKHPLSGFPPCVVTRVIVSQDLVGTLTLGHTHIRSLIFSLGTSPKVVGAGGCSGEWVLGVGQGFPAVT